jgi:hypothetical protein
MLILQLYATVSCDTGGAASITQNFHEEQSVSEGGEQNMWSRFPRSGGEELIVERVQRQQSSVFGIQAAAGYGKSTGIVSIVLSALSKGKANSAMHTAEPLCIKWRIQPHEAD